MQVPNTNHDLTAIDLFAGAGGISLGLQTAGFDVLLANDNNISCSRTYQRNFPEKLFFEGDIRNLMGGQVLKMTGLRRGQLDLLIGGPPCQGFSIIGKRVVLDPRNNLFKEFLRIGNDLRPKCMVIENVPGLVTLASGEIMNNLVVSIESMGYHIQFAELLTAQYGIPQMRWRMFFVAFREDLGIAAGMGFPKPTHGRRGIGQLVPNCPISAEDTDGFLTTRDAIGDLPPVNAGEEVHDYTGRPSGKYQIMMRDGLSRELHNHYAPNLSQRNLVRIAALKPGQDWRDLPRDLLPEGMKRAKRKDHTRRFSRMSWEGIPRSIITRFRDPKSGEYTHPEQDRTITIREAARIQSFPDRFVFEASHSEQYDQVGNAVPPILARAVATEVSACLRGEATHKLKNAFSRRPSLYQARLCFDSL